MSRAHITADAMPVVRKSPLMAYFIDERSKGCPDIVWRSALEMEDTTGSVDSEYAIERTREGYTAHPKDSLFWMRAKIAFSRAIIAALTIWSLLCESPTLGSIKYPSSPSSVAASGGPCAIPLLRGS
jgi:hypothetical protein